VVVEPAVVRLPRLLLAVRDHPRQSLPPDAGLLLHDLGLLDLVRLSANATVPLAVDVDTVEGLAPDRAAISFLAERSHVRIVISKRPSLAEQALACGCLPLLHVHGLDSTGLDRALGTHPGRSVGTAISPGLLLAHLTPRERELLPRPVVAYGLLRSHDEAQLALAAGADAVVMAPPTLDRQPARLYKPA
jgi:glycerol-3-phosphate responsive antiterminator